MAVASRLHVGRDRPWLAERTGGWKAVSSFARCTFFILGLVAAGLVASILDLMHVPAFLLVSGLCLVVAAEWLIVQRRFFGMGIGEALEVAGLLMIAFQAVDQIGDTAGVRISLLIALALAVAGFRLLNPLFVTGSTLAVSCAISFLDTRHFGAHISPAFMASAYCMTVAFIALFIGRVQFLRPSHDQMLNWLVVSMPLAGFLWFEAQNRPGLSIEMLREAPFFRWLPVVALSVFGLTALILGIHRRSHAPILAFMICVGCLAYELRHLTTLSLQAKLIGYGSAILLLSIGLDRYLRTPRRGITSNQFAENKGALDLLQIAGASGLTSASAHHPDANFKGAGGTFGGGGASASF